MISAASDDTVISTDALSYDYSGVSAVSNVGISVRKGQVVALIGGNGAGKSTTVKMIAGALKPKTGRVSLRGENITGMPSYKVVQKGVALVPEGRLVFNQLTVLENLKVAGHLPRARNSLSDNYEHVFGLFPRLYERRAQNAGSLSGGEQQMLAIARGLMTMPDVLILDEPSLGLSPLFVGEIFKMIRALNSEGMTILLVEQNVHHSLEISDWAFILEKGQVVRSDTGQSMLADDSIKKAYLGID